MKARAHVGEGGRVVIPAAMRRLAGIRKGDELLLVFDGGVIRLMTPAQAAREAQAVIRAHVPAGRSLSEELVRERRDESRS